MKELFEEKEDPASENAAYLRKEGEVYKIGLNITETKNSWFIVMYDRKRKKIIKLSKNRGVVYSELEGIKDGLAW
jgi:hypothetical protein